MYENINTERKRRKDDGRGGYNGEMRRQKNEVKGEQRERRWMGGRETENMKMEIEEGKEMT